MIPYYFNLQHDQKLCSSSIFLFLSDSLDDLHSIVRYPFAHP